MDGEEIQRLRTWAELKAAGGNDGPTESYLSYSLDIEKLVLKALSTLAAAEKERDRLLPYVEAFRREERRADKLDEVVALKDQELSDLRAQCGGMEMSLGEKEEEIAKLKAGLREKIREANRCRNTVCTFPDPDGNCVCEAELRSLLSAEEGEEGNER